MTFLLLAFAAGVLTIVSPCILPVLPFVLARAGRPFLRNGLPLLLGMALSFTAVATLAAVGGGWAVQANEYGRSAALGLLAVFALTLMFPGFADWLSRPLVALGARLASSSEGGEGGTSGDPSLLSSLLLGVATGLLWAPCAGPVLGLILTGAAIQGANAGTSLLLLAYAGGAATSLALSLLAGGRVYALLRRSLGISHWARRGMGAAVLAGVALIATGLDTGLLSRLSLSSTSGIEQALINAFQPQASQEPGIGGAADAEAPAPETITLVANPGAPSAPADWSGRTFAPLAGATGWINTPPLAAADLRGKVVLVDFWTYSCINCLRTLPYIRAWADKYREAGLVVVGVHSPEFAFEKNEGHVRLAVKDLGINYPVAIDSKHAVWRGFENQSWPALYFVDAQGRVRHQVVGEGQYEASERLIQKLLAEKNGKGTRDTGLVAVQGEGVQAAPGGRVMSGETYVGHERAVNFVPEGGLQPDRRYGYEAAASVRLNHWTLGGEWTVEAERAVAAQAGARLAYRFRARDLHLVLGREAGAAPVRFRVRVNGRPPAQNRGTDIAADGSGVIDAHRLYQLVRLPASAGDHLFEIEFLDPGAQVYAFTFG